MKIKEKKIKQHKQINRLYIITSKELKEKLEVEGEIFSISWVEGKSIKSDKWKINTREIIKGNKEIAVLGRKKQE